MADNDNSHSDALCHLCSLINTSLLPSSEPQQLLTTSLTQQNEKTLLISLTKVLNQIPHCSNHHFTTKHDCLAETVLTLISLLNVNSKYVHHLLTNIFVALSKHLLLTNEDNWGKFVRLLCCCFELALENVLVVQSSEKRAETVEFCLRELYDVIQVKLSGSSWKVVSGIVRILREIVKVLKRRDEEGEVVAVMVNLLGVSFSRVSSSLLEVGGEAEEKMLFLGHFVQLLCSLVGSTGAAETSDGGSKEKDVVLGETCRLVPMLLSWCFDEGCDDVRFRRIQPYFQHKILALMIRLSVAMDLDYPTLVKWLELLHTYYQHVLSIPISQPENGQDDSLEDSPFLLSLLDEDVNVNRLSSRHLQRQAVFLFLRCSVCLITLSKSADVNATLVKPSSLLSHDLTVQDNCCEKKWLLNLSVWLQKYVSCSIHPENEMYLENCIKFASSFIRLFLNEDDMLFQVLLQTFSIPSCAERLEARARPDAEEDVLFHLSNLLNPLLLFHVFLAELHYDHHLLLDYLISKDTGSECAEYLLRSLRCACESWELFVEFSGRNRTHVQESCKRRKVFQVSLEKQRGVPSSLSELCHEQKSENFVKRSLDFEDAKACMVSLKSALTKLQRRKLFPYNAEVLIRRLKSYAVSSETILLMSNKISHGKDGSVILW